VSIASRSTAARIFSGSAATWCRIGITIFCQVALVPIYLGKWNAGIYGVWLAATALVGLLQIVSTGFQGYLQNEFLRIGAGRPRLLRRHFGSAAAIAVGIGVVEFGVTVVVALSPLAGKLTGSTTVPGLEIQVSSVIILNEFVWLLSWAWGGLAVRVLSCFGYFANLAWTGVAYGLVTGVAPAVAVALGANVLTAGIVLAASTLFVMIPLTAYMHGRMRECGLFPLSLDWQLGFRVVARSQLITVRTLLEMLRQQGVRLVMAPLAGAAELAAFATTRTWTNAALQGLGTVTQPLMPELMRYLAGRDQARTVGAFGAVWVLLLGAMIPGSLVLQVVAPSLFELWTRGKIPFDPILFALLTSGVLIYAMAQPAQAIVTGNNLLVPQLVLSILCATVGVGGMFMLIPMLGVVGAAWSLFAAEVVSAIGNTLVAAQWTRRKGMRWPWPENGLVGGVTLGACGGLGLLALFPAGRWGILTVTLAGSALAAGVYWRHLPQLVQERLSALIGARLGPLKRLFPSLNR
jgi:O-antigen/teichoic acid export membrane protein